MARVGVRYQDAPSEMRPMRIRRCEHGGMTATTAGRVPALIEELDRYPDDRAEIVFEIVDGLRRAGDDEAALGWLRTLTAAGGFDGSMARVQLAEIHFDAGRADLAVAELDAIRDSRERGPDAYAMAAELLAERGDEQGALRWFTMAASRFTDEQCAAARGEFGWMSAAYGVLWQRRELRVRLGYAPDDLEDGLWEPPARRSLAGGAAFPSTDQAWADPRIGAAEAIRILTWPERDFAVAKQRWPHLLDQATSHGQYRARLESQLRDTALRGPSKIGLVHARVDALHDYAERTGGSVEDAATRRGYLAEQAGLGNLLAWPPGRNAPCWCGSAVKYKKCCGRPGR